MTRRLLHCCRHRSRLPTLASYSTSILPTPRGDIAPVTRPPSSPSNTLVYPHAS